ncbi:MAG: hypothetical protein ACO4CS_20565 [bacterium]
MKFAEIEFKTGRFDGKSAKLPLAGGLELSIIQNKYSYGGDQGLWEIGLIDPNVGRMVFVKPWQDQVKGYLTEQDVENEIDFLNKELKLLASDLTRLISYEWP